eukprot:gnl/TRDRNA2_/TRDRNA2_143612_c1_seq1.p1 gnl/TRDRNA2_/TRDRNA2_143612_c1~~gnl/TRDRNA2_/TRDRNA2_143612_c1_seq1.p1  ORF type:complete len:307 (+),score=74.95 gnl/TRDRNA2_/TRDRNA2_143612_c1_seq1:105-923(+)
MSDVADAEFQQMKRIGSSAVKECAELTLEKEQRAFVVNSMTGGCWLLPETADSVVMPLSDANQTAKGLECYNKLPGFPMDIYQPWNAHWYKYSSHLKQIVKGLEAKTPGILEKVRQAYASYCPRENLESKKSTGKSVPPACSEPSSWEHADAIKMLQRESPLSAAQLHGLRASIQPEAAEEVADMDEPISFDDLYDRRQFGVAWERFLGSKEKWSEADAMMRSMGEEAPTRTVQKSLVQKLESIAELYNMRLEDGVFDLAAANGFLEQQVAS